MRTERPPAALLLSRSSAIHCENLTVSLSFFAKKKEVYFRVYNLFFVLKVDLKKINPQQF